MLFISVNKNNWSHELIQLIFLNFFIKYIKNRMCFTQNEYHYLFEFIMILLELNLYEPYSNKIHEFSRHAFNNQIIINCM